MSKILVIDDNELVSLMLKEHLAQEGYEVALAADANRGYAEAIEFVPDLILLDVQLPDVVGFDLIRIIKNRDDLRQIPIIMITGTARTAEDTVKGFQLGADDYVLKPFEMPVLLERIKVHLRRAQSRPPESPGVGTSPLFAPTPAQAVPPTPVLSAGSALTRALLDPLNFPEKTNLPPLSLAAIGSALILVLGGLGLTAGSAIKPAIAFLAAGSLWIALISALVMTASLAGIHLGWKEGGRLVGLASVPLLLKLLGGLAACACTTLAPFYFTASPALFMDSPSFWVSRLDVFELWAVALVWILLHKRTGASAKTASIVAGVVWLVGIGLEAGFGRLGGGG
jgi:CheY-like chemotaxis protein